MDARFFAIPDESEHMAVLASEKKIYRLRIFISVILLLIICVPSFLFMQRMDSMFDGPEESADEKDYLAGFDITEERIISELYGSPEEYADSMLFKNKSGFLDREKTAATGKMTYNEAAMEEYRNRMLEEFNSRVDRAEVERVLEERRAAYIENSKAERESAEAVKTTHNWKLLLIIAVFLTGVVIALILWGRRYSHIKNREYMITDGIITEKTLVSRVRIIGIKRLATVSYKGGAEKVRLTHLQGLSLGVGENVALIAVTAGMCSFHVCKM